METEEHISKRAQQISMLQDKDTEMKRTNLKFVRRTQKLLAINIFNAFMHKKKAQLAVQISNLKEMLKSKDDEISKQKKLVAQEKTAVARCKDQIERVRKEGA